jgi:hypothetical protein
MQQLLTDLFAQLGRHRLREEADLPTGGRNRPEPEATP